MQALQVLPMPALPEGVSGNLHVLQLSDPHLLADPQGVYRGVNPYEQLRHGLEQAIAQLERPPDLLLISGDLCQDESLAGYGHLCDLLTPLRIPLALLPGNHDNPALIRQALGGLAALAPAALQLGPWRLILISSHRPGSPAGCLDDHQLRWLRGQLAGSSAPTWLAIHHPPVPIGSPSLDAIALQHPEPLLELLAASPLVRGVLFGHVHQHWQGQLPGSPEVPLFACPSTLCAFPSSQPCPLGRPQDPGGRWLELRPDRSWAQRLLRWSAFSPGERA
ncbi:MULTISPECIES: metallophosphoesterase [unclassified Synechococcus]|uniref:metallophosphoesterase n=1 Tax=unclassified Synechococcus TaxID=2626047 RepID=UPI0021A549E5|nr:MULTISPECIES: metallophosphoesterase [unclassified Synechococcus]